MTELLTTVTRKGQVTIPANIRKAMGIEVGDKVSFSIDKDKETVIILRPVRSVAEMTYGMAAALSPLAAEERIATDKDLREQFEAATVERFTRRLE